MRYAILFLEHPGALILMHTEAKVDSKARKEAFANKAKLLGYKEKDIEAIKAIIKAYDESPDKSGIKETFLRKCWGEFYAKNPYQQQDFDNYVTNLPMRRAFALNENLQFDYHPELHKITCPVWYVASDLDPGHPYEGAQETAKLIANAEFTLFEGLGAPAYRDDPVFVKEFIVQMIKHMLSLLM